jgi:hypothetical protein
VRKSFPIPLINRLEKHVLTTRTILSEKQIRLVDELKRWAKNFVTITDVTVPKPKLVSHLTDHDLQNVAKHLMYFRHCIAWLHPTQYFNSAISGRLTACVQCLY